jgi:MoaA/NifB/PqqE/SkfB family radical SAM enzyme
MAAPSFPREVGIETVNYCNARCPFCPLFQGDEQLDRSIRPTTTMSSDLFHKICRQIASWPEKPGCIYLNMDGEPLMDSLFDERLSVLKDLDLARLVYIQTNGQFMTEEKARVIIDAGIGSIFYALDGATKDIYESMRIRCDFDRVLANLKRFVEIREEAHSAAKINIKYVRTTQNDYEVRDCYDMVEDFLDPELDTFHDTISVDWGVKSLSDKEIIFSRINNREKMVRRPEGCPSLHSMLVVFADGRVPACCWDYNLDVRAGKDFGNANESFLLDIWHGQHFEQLRDALQAGDAPPKCASCIMLFEPNTEMPAAKVADELTGRSPGYGYIYRFKSKVVEPMTIIAEAAPQRKPGLWERFLGGRISK